MKTKISKPVKVITFDLDDTLWSLKSTLDHAEKETYTWLQQNANLITNRYSAKKVILFRKEFFVNNSAFSNQISQLRLASYQQLALKSGYSNKQALTIATAAFNVFIKLRQQVNYFSNTEITLANLSKRFLIGAITNGNANIYDMSIGRFFKFSVSAESLNSSKPEPAIFLHAKELAEKKLKTTLLNEQIAHIGDDLSIDVMGANNVGFKAVWFKPSLSAQEKPIKTLGKKNAYTSIRDIGELTNFDFTTL